MTLRELIADGRTHLFDGAMGTMLYGRGVFLNVCFDELVLRQPDLVKEIHREYVRAGAEVDRQRQRQKRIAQLLTGGGDGGGRPRAAHERITHWAGQIESGRQRAHRVDVRPPSFATFKSADGMNRQTGNRRELFLSETRHLPERLELCPKCSRSTGFHDSSSYLCTG